MNWDRKGASDALEAKKCFVCGDMKPVHVVVTMHGKQDLHFPCCSTGCQDVVAEIIFETVNNARK